MAERPKLTLLCHTEPDDMLQVVRSAGYIRVLVTDSSSDDIVTACMYLNQESARALFNWLGVQLHKGGWDP